MDYMKAIKDLRGLLKAIRKMALAEASPLDQAAILQAEAIECASRLKQIKVDLKALGVAL